MGGIASVLRLSPAVFVPTLSPSGFLSIRFSCASAAESGLIEPGLDRSDWRNRLGGADRSAEGTWGACLSR